MKRKSRLTLIIASVILLIILATISFLILLMRLSERIENVSKHYESYAEASKDNKLKTILPPSASDIYFQRDIDTREIWVRFSIRGVDQNKLTSGFKKLRREDIQSIMYNDPPGADWWFNSNYLYQNDEKNSLEQKAVFSGKCDDEVRPTSFLAIDYAQERAYYWCGP